MIRSRLTWRWWALAAAWWTVDGLVGASQVRQMSDASGRLIAWSHALATSLATAWLWIPPTLLALWLASRLPLERGRWAARLPWYAAATAAVVLFRAAAVVALNGRIGWYDRMPPFADVLVTSVQNNTFLFFLLVGVAHAVHYARAVQERESQLAQAQLVALKAQIQPHFLFNALNTIASFVRSDPSAAERTVSRLSELLRRGLQGGDAHEVPLSEELAFVSAYLEIEAARFEDRLRVRWHVDEEVLDAQVPPLVLQPLVENAIRHGISPRVAPGTLEVSARRENGRVRLAVRDDGVGLPPPDGAHRPARPVRGHGVGLANVRARLRELYGDAAELDVSPTPGGGVTVTLTLPFRPVVPTSPPARFDVTRAWTPRSER